MQDMPEAATQLNVLYPLDIFYRRLNLKRPDVMVMEAEALPEPYRRLLAHYNDMTPTLEEFHGERIFIEVLEQWRDSTTLSRMVSLRLHGSLRAVEFGAIIIYLRNFPAIAQELILEGRLPLGTIMAEQDVERRSHPQCFLRLQSDPLMRSALGLTQHATLYGRRNILTTPDSRTLAEIVEILPPNHLQRKSSGEGLNEPFS
jgi:chorismate-pyruvate lyase